MPADNSAPNGRQLLENIPAILIDGVTISAARVLRQAAFENTIREHLITRAVQERTLTVLPEELARARAMFTADMHFSADSELRAWLRVRGMTERELEEELQRIILFGKLKQQVAQDAVEPYFEAHRADYESAVVSRILLSERVAAERVLLELAHGVEFEEVARRESTDLKTRQLGGFLGRVRRRELSSNEAAFVFDASPVPKISAPIAVKNGVVLLRVERRFPAQLDQPTRAEIHEHLFAAWLDRERARSSVELKLW